MDQSTGETVPGIVEDDVTGLRRVAALPIALRNREAEGDGRTFDVKEMLQPGHADEAASLGIANRPEAPAFGSPTALGGFERGFGLVSSSAPAVDELHHVVTAVKRADLIEIGRAEGKEGSPFGPQ